ncbi:TrmB family transcriptional regulator [filamentous cyanobacterium LEGE 11480]|uniref:TrmB family transcriptional regulator n=1 Tax=Romeriopsis navalis LEGE 11480 TaxID=2777977 RepID=A0A928VLN5_9CYAN|nr:helix-turn-helix domain-containing protein [Romeriopsis navalis]MBE9030008.1 TrmB family transcriptional regulator [Romeriopsis navalis LEGE 11480]
MNDQKTLESLGNLGLTKYESAVYRTLLERQDFTPTQLATRAQVPRQRIYDVLSSLVDRGLCIERHSGKQRLFSAVNPAVALPTLLQTKQEQFDAEITQQKQQAELMVKALAPLYAAGNDTQDPLAYIDVLSEPNRIVDRGAQLAESVEQSICVFFTHPSLMSYEDGLKLVKGPIDRGISYRSVYEKSMWEDPSSREFIQQCQAWGQAVRFVPELPFKMQLFDDQVTLLSLQDPLAGNPSFTALCVTHPGLAKMLQISFEVMWRSGVEQL